MENQNNTNTNQLQTQPVGFMQKLKYVFFGKGSAIPGNPFDGMGPIDISLLIFKNLFKGLKALFIKKVIITVVVLALGWFFTNLLVEDYSRKGIPFLLNLFCFFTYAKAGIYGNLTSVLGGILGKSIIGGLIISILMGTTDKKPYIQLKPDFEGNKLSNICSFVTGIGIAFVLFNFMTVNLDKYNSMIGLVMFFLCMKIQADPKSILLASLNSFAKNRPINPKAARMLLLGVSWGSLAAFAACWFVTKQAEIFYDIGYIVAGIGAIAYIISLFKTPMVPVATALALFVLCIIPMANCDYKSQINKALRDIEKEIPRLEAHIKQAEASVRNARTPQEKAHKEEELNSLRESLKATKFSASQLKMTINAMNYGGRPPLENICGSSFGGAAGAVAGAAGAGAAAAASAAAGAAAAAGAGAAGAAAGTGASAAAGATTSAGTLPGTGTLPESTGESANTADLPKKKKEDEEEEDYDTNENKGKKAEVNNILFKDPKSLTPEEQRKLLQIKKDFEEIKQLYGNKNYKKFDDFCNTTGEKIDSITEKIGDLLDWSAGDDAGLAGNLINLGGEGYKNYIKPFQDKLWNNIASDYMDTIKVATKDRIAGKVISGVGKVGKFAGSTLGWLGIAGDAYTNTKAGDNAVYATAKSYVTNNFVGAITEKNITLVGLDAANQFCFGGTKASGICSPTGNIKNVANLAIDSASTVFTGNTDEVAKRTQDGVYGDNVKNLADSASMVVDAIEDPSKFGDEFYNYAFTDRAFDEAQKSLEEIFKSEDGTTGFIATSAKNFFKDQVDGLQKISDVSCSIYDNNTIIRTATDNIYIATAAATDIGTAAIRGTVNLAAKVRDGNFDFKETVSELGKGMENAANTAGKAVMDIYDRTGETIVELTNDTIKFFGWD